MWRYTVGVIIRLVIEKCPGLWKEQRGQAIPGGGLLDRDGADEELILVDEDDNVLGFRTKLGAHRYGGVLHRAFSIFIFDTAGRMLLQRRAKKKYLFAGLWTNACCSHPRKGEALQDAVHRRLQQEFGFDTELEETFTFLYRASDPRSGLTEHELDHVFCGRFNGDPRPNPEEIDDWKWIDLAALMTDLGSNPHRYTPWFKIAVHRMMEAPPEVCFATTFVPQAGDAHRHDGVRRLAEPPP